MKTLKKSLLAIALAGAFTAANATPVDWTLGYTSVTDGTFSISGTFTYDADKGVFSNTNLTGIAYDNAIPTASISFATNRSGGRLLISNNAGGYSLSLSDLLTNAGGSVSVTSGYAPGYRSFTTLGTLTGVPQATASAVPEPEAYAMMLAGLGLVGFAARRKQQAA